MSGIIRRGRLAMAVVVAWVVLMPTGTAKTRHGFSVMDDLQTVRFVDSFDSGLQSPAIASPDGKKITVVLERGDAQHDTVEDALWVFDVAKTHGYVGGADLDPAQIGGKLLSVADKKSGALSQLRWTQDSSGLLYLARTPSGRHGLYRVSLDRPAPELISAEDQDVTAFDSQGESVVFSAISPAASQEAQVAPSPGYEVMTGKTLRDVLLSKLPGSRTQELRTLCNLWLAHAGKVSRINTATGEAFHVHQSYRDHVQRVFWLSPDGQSLAALMPVKSVPESWEQLAPSHDLPPRRIRSGVQDIDQIRMTVYVSRFSLVNLKSGRAVPLTAGPAGWQDSYYSALPVAAWSADSKTLALSNTFTSDAAGSRPCVAVVSASAPGAGPGTACLISLPDRAAELHASQGLHRIIGLDFADPGGTELWVNAVPEQHTGGGDYGEIVSLRYQRGPSGTWTYVDRTARSANSIGSLRFEVQESLSSPPRLVATDTADGRTKVILDPNDALRDVALGETGTLHWKDREGRLWSGALIEPEGFEQGKRYPLVIQTHGFDPRQFLTYGSFPSCMAARELAATGFVVLQVAGPQGSSRYVGTPAEGPMATAGYQSAIQQLTHDGIVDPRAVGAIGFSRTVFAVMNALAFGDDMLQTAAICDGIQVGYFEYVVSGGTGGSLSRQEYEALMGGAPFGRGFDAWRQHSPDFNLDRIRAPLLIQAFGTDSMVSMWEPYVGLDALHKPVELALLDTDEHVLTNPRIRLQSQSLSIDWLRFWLQGFEDADPSKSSQYSRWEKLCDLQIASQPRRPHFCPTSLRH